MRRVFAIATALFMLMSTQIGAQTPDLQAPQKEGATADPFSGAKDPFSRDKKASRRDTTVDKKAISKRNTPFAKSTANRDASRPNNSAPAALVVGPRSGSVARINRALDLDTAFDYLDQPLSDVVQDIAFAHNIPIIIDAKALLDFGIDLNSPVSISLKGISLRSALRLLLNELELTYMIQDEVLQVTTPEEAETRPSIRIYSISDLLPSDGDRDAEVFVELITTMVAPDTWQVTGGRGAVVYLKHIESLVIRQTEEVFDGISELLASIRQSAEQRTTAGQIRQIVPLPN